MGYTKYIISASITSLIFMYARAYLFRSFLDNTNDLGWRIFLALAFTSVAAIFAITGVGDTDKWWKKLFLFLFVFFVVQYLLYFYLTNHI